MNREPGRAFALSLGSLALTAPFAVHLYLPLIPSVKQSFGLTD